ncbi:MAG: alpha/beta family hydrolase [Myxococcota bacterium]
MTRLEPHALLIDNPSGSPSLLLAHGAGAGADTPFLTTFATGLAAHGVRVVRFEFDYMRRQRATSRRSPPDREPALLACFRRAAELTKSDTSTLYLGGKSMGGRMASLLAAELPVRGLVCLGYPFHPPGRGDTLRTAHLRTLRTPTLIVQGSRDPFGTAEEVNSYGLSKTIELCFLDDGDHSFKPRRNSGHTEAEHLAHAVTAVARFLARQPV